MTLTVDLPTCRVHRATCYIDARGRVRWLDRLMNIVACEICEYRFALDDPAAAETQRVTHLRSAHHDDLMTGRATIYLAAAS